MLDSGTCGRLTGRVRLNAVCDMGDAAMELPGELYLFNFSLLAMTFAAVSALVMLLRQTMGGKLSSFDVFLVNAYVAHGFVLAIAAILPPLIAQFALPLPVVWAVASGLAAVLIGGKVAGTMRQRSTVIKTPMPWALKVSFGAQWFAILLLVANAMVPAIQGIAVFELALTICLAMVLWSFVRRISTLLGDHPSEDWDPNRG